MASGKNTELPCCVLRRESWPRVGLSYCSREDDEGKVKRTIMAVAGLLDSCLPGQMSKEAALAYRIIPFRTVSIRGWRDSSTPKWHFS
jgi:hypothetical protein